MMQWVIICDTAKRATWLMHALVNKYRDGVLNVDKTHLTVVFYDGIGLNTFLFIRNDSERLLGLRPDIMLYAYDFKQMWLLE